MSLFLLHVRTQDYLTLVRTVSTVVFALIHLTVPILWYALGMYVANGWWSVLLSTGRISGIQTIKPA